jgi:hypothetical protein
MKCDVALLGIGAPHDIPKLVKSAPSTTGESRIPRQICSN